MNINWKKTLVVIIDIAVCAYLVLAVVAFNKPDSNKGVCTQVKIDIGGNVVQGFLDADEIKQILERNHIYPLAKPMQDIDVRRIEETLTRSPFVDEAQCYKTQDGHVCIGLTQRMPVMRVIADNGEDYYVDNLGGIMTNATYRGDVVIANGPISKLYARKVLTNIGNYLVNNRFWRNQIVQIHVLNDGSMEMVPRVGEHVVYLGQPTEVEQKLERLQKFYKYGLSKAGWNKYSYINLEFENQIICKKRNHHVNKSI